MIGNMPRSTKIYANFETATELRSGYFPENELGDDPAFLIFSGFTDKG